MTLIYILVGVGLGFFVAACLMVYVISSCAKGSDKDRAHRVKIDEQLIGQQKQIMFATARVADALEQMNPEVSELRRYLDGWSITGDNIGDIRRKCFLPWASSWNSIVRDETAKRENMKPSLAIAQGIAECQK